MNFQKTRAIWTRTVLVISISISMIFGVAGLYEANEERAVEAMEALTLFQYGSFEIHVISLLITFLIAWAIIPAIDLLYGEYKDLVGGRQ